MRTSNRPLRVAINGYFFRHRTTGSGQYLEGLAAALPGAAPHVALSFFQPDRLGRATVSVLKSDAPISNIAKLAFEQITLPAAAHSSDLLHYPYWAAPLRSKLPVVVTVHDLIPLLLSAYRGSLLARCYSALAAMGTRRATMMIADSAATKHDLVARLNIPPERVRVIYLAASPAFRPVLDLAARRAVREKFGLGSPFIFYVGGLDQRKNVDRLIAWFAKALPLLSVRHVLVIAGNADKRGALFADLRRVARDYGVAEAVHFLGAVPTSALPLLYQEAALVAFPSSYEGFGLPPLEALASGAALLCSNAGSLAEVVGDAAITLDPADDDAWPTSIVRLLTEPGLAAELRRRGPSQAARFDWQTTAAETAAVYQEAVERWRRSARCA